uniref:Uncharacterized protein n=1 Tax=Spongospora subterranea TaxID=70186 RepID=A0A0H5QTT4_9EUKA|eukprot:CRZ04981.1 hypothetical protein [Spongospora subterranea]
MAMSTSNSSVLDEVSGSHSEDIRPTLSSSRSHPTRVDIDELYRIKLNVLVKPYKNAQARSSLSLGVLDINVSSSQAFQGKIFDRAVQHVEGIAILGPQGYSLRAEPMTCVDLDSMVSFKHRNHFYNAESITASILQNWTAREHTVDCFIYKYGLNVQTLAQYSDFQAAVLEPAEADRAGAASNDVVSTIMNQLRNRWGTTYMSQSINWQIWANSISIEPINRHEALIAQPPPMDIIHLFRHSPTDSDVLK